MSETVRLLLQDFQNEILEAIVLGQSLDAVSSLICRGVESLAPGAICSLIRIKDSQLRPLAAPSLPAAFSQALEGVVIGPDVGSCGTAAWRGVPVEVRDIAGDPLWNDYRALALPLGLRACWSSPILASDGSVLATFAFYYQEPRGPTELERQLVAATLHLGAIAIERSEAEAMNRRLARFDALTGLPNRRSFDVAIAALCAAPDPHFGLLLLGFDRLDSLDVGLEELSSERLVRDVASRLGAIGPDAWAASLGGDRFAVLIEPCRDHAHLREAGLEILAALKQPKDWAAGGIERGVAIGGALYGPDGTTPEVLRQNAELSRAAAKASSHRGYVGFEPALRSAALQRRSMLRDVEMALVDGRIVPHYQPVVRLADRRIVGLEALLRMHLPDGRIALAAEFQGAFSDPRLAYALTSRLFDLVARDAAGWLADGIDFGHIGVNVAMADVFEDDIGDRLDATFSAAGVPLRHLIVEVTEMIIMDDPSHDLADAVERLRKRGVLVALDDFGTGYASLTHLLNFPSDIIKIDRSFIDRMLTDRNSLVIVESLIDIARKLDRRVVAEGIENEAQAELLLDLGCRLGQGISLCQRRRRRRHAAPPRRSAAPRQEQRVCCAVAGCGSHLREARAGRRSSAARDACSIQRGNVWLLSGGMRCSTDCKDTRWPTGSLFSIVRPARSID